MNSVSDVAADQERAGDGLGEGGGGGGEAVEEGGDQRGFGAGGGDGADFFVVEEGDYVYVAGEGGEEGGGGDGGEGFYCCESGRCRLGVLVSCGGRRGEGGTDEENWLSRRGLKMNSFFSPAKVAGWTSYRCLYNKC